MTKNIVLVARLLALVWFAFGVEISKIYKKETQDKDELVRKEPTILNRTKRRVHHGRYGNLHVPPKGYISIRKFSSSRTYGKGDSRRDTPSPLDIAKFERDANYSLSQLNKAPLPPRGVYHRKSPSPPRGVHHRKSPSPPRNVQDIHLRKPPSKQSNVGHRKQLPVPIHGDSPNQKSSKSIPIHGDIPNQKSSKSNGKSSSLQNDLILFTKDLEGQSKNHTKGHVKLIAYPSKLLPTEKYGYMITCSGSPLVYDMKDEVTKFKSVIIEIKGNSDKEPRPLVGIIGDEVVWNDDIEWPHEYRHRGLAHATSLQYFGKVGLNLTVPFDSCGQYDYEISCKVFNMRKDKTLAKDVSRKINLNRIRCPLYRRRRDRMKRHKWARFQVKDDFQVYTLYDCPTSSVDSSIAALEFLEGLLLVMIIGVLIWNYELKKKLDRMKRKIIVIKS